MDLSLALSGCYAAAAAEAWLPLLFLPSEACEVDSLRVGLALSVSSILK